MYITKPTDGYSALAEAVIRWCIYDINRKYTDENLYKAKYIACLFFMDDDCKELWCGLAPHMIRDYEHYRKVAKELLDTEFLNYSPRRTKDEGVSHKK